MKYGVDCDLNRIYVVDALRRPILNGVPLASFIAWVDSVLEEDVVLFEIASATDYTDDEGNKGQAYNKRRWMLFNMHAATLGHLHCDGQFLVAPSSAWTNGYKRDMRHKLAECVTKNKDLREAECMVFMHGHLPGKWTSLDLFVAGI